MRALIPRKILSLCLFGRARSFERKFEDSVYLCDTHLFFLFLFGKLESAIHATQCVQVFTYRPRPIIMLSGDCDVPRTAFPEEQR